MQNKPDYPHMCYVLGEEGNPIKPREYFEYDSSKDKYYIDENGDVMISSKDFTSRCVPCVVLSMFINNREKIKRLPATAVNKTDFTRDEVGFLRLLIALGYFWIARDKDGKIYIYTTEPQSCEDFYTLSSQGIEQAIPDELLSQITFENSPIDMRKICEKRE